jgi:2-polyprenyl-6-methoxyphenol hydroxylase-like FAD-dependent oxidoreductase
LPLSASQVFADISAQQPPEQHTALMGTAAVLGGSVAGLLAARVLSDYAERVVLIDPDGPVADDDARPGVPHGTQVHALLPGGRRQFERWFPGFSTQTVAAGALEAHSHNRRTYIDGRLKQWPLDEVQLTASRPFLEAAIRRRVLALPNVVVTTGRATALEFAHGAVSGVRFDTAEGGGVENADLTVDAMGRSSRLSSWLEQGGWERPPMRRMTVNLNYSTAIVARDEDAPKISIGLALNTPTSPQSPEVAGAIFLPIEKDRWIVMMGGYGDSRPGRTIEDMRARLRRDFPPEFGSVIGNELQSDITTYRHADSRRRDFHLLERLPARLVSVGDAVASVNPIYGQGMSSAALHGATLARYLRSHPDLSAPAREFFDLQRVVVDAAWQTSTSADLALPHVDGPYPRGYRLTRWLSGQIMRASITDRAVSHRFDAVTTMLSHPSTLATPGLLLRALRVNLRAHGQG